jgi:23S rRNA (guanosine2251-2'-O)-methyltransferase
MAAVRSRPVDHVLVREGSASGRIEEILKECRSREIPFRFVPRAALDRLAGTGGHQDVVAVCSPKAYDDLSELFERPKVSMLVVLDGVEDPANLGAIIRTVVAAGASGVVVGERRAAGLSPAVARASVGALEYARVARVKNLTRALMDMKERGIWVYGFEARSEKSYLDLDYKVPCALVMGGEGRGLHRLVRETCDQHASIPLQGPVESLNVSVATGIILYEALRQRSGS